ncbi:MAG: hypothetical protein KGI60_01490 [Patescibacteria group bacterium]|nr:hypothetical protein [Patescibacteria group bacterium]
MAEGNIAERINTLLKFYKVTPRVLGKMFGVSESTIRRWTKGKGTSRVHRLNALDKLEKMMERSCGSLKRDRAWEWFHANNECLRGISPIEHIIKYSPQGFDQILDMLYSITFGFPA